VGGAVRHNLIVYALRRLCREHHSESIFAPLRCQRQRARLARGPRARGREVLRLVDHVEAAGRARVSKPPPDTKGVLRYKGVLHRGSENAMSDQGQLEEAMRAFPRYKIFDGRRMTVA
jgi:hypothetical protein